MGSQDNAGQTRDKAGGMGSRLTLVVVMLVFGTVGLFIRAIDLPSAHIAFSRALIAFLVLTVFLLITGRFRVLYEKRRQLSRFLLSGAVMAVNWILLFESYRYTSIALATLAYYVAPTLMVIGSAIFFKEGLRPLQVACFVLSTLGLVLMLGVSSASAGDVRGILLGLASAVLYAAVIMLNKSAPQVDSIARTYVQFLAALLVMLPFILLTGGFVYHRLDTGGWLALATLGIVHTGLCYCLYFTAIARLRGQQVAILSYLDPLAAVLLSVLFLGEKVSGLQLLGGAVMLAAAMLNETLGRTMGSPKAQGPEPGQ